MRPDRAAIAFKGVVISRHIRAIPSWRYATIGWPRPVPFLSQEAADGVTEQVQLVSPSIRQ